MVYQIHLECTTTVSDDTTGELKVYAMASKEYLDMNVTSNNNLVREYMKDAITSSHDYLYLMGTDADAQGDVPTNISGHIFTYNPSFGNIDTANLDINVDYSVYVMAVDTNNNYSDVYTPDLTNDGRAFDHLRGRIDARPAPVISNISGTFATSGITLNTTITSDVYFDYYAATFDQQQTSTGLETFFADTTVPTTVFTKVIKNSGNIAFLEKVTDDITDGAQSLTNVVLDIIKPTNYTPFVDLTQPLYTYIYALNENPHATFASSFVQNVPVASKSLAVTLTSYSQVNETVINAIFNVDWNGNGTSSIELFVAMYDTERTGFQSSGSIKEDILTIYTHKEVLTVQTPVINIVLSQYKNATDNTIADVVNGNTYFMYYVARDTNTGETTLFKYQEIVYRPQDGLPILRAPDDALVEQFVLLRNPLSLQIDNSATNYSIQYELYDLNVYIMLVDDNLLNSELNVGNTALKAFMRDNHTVMTGERLVYKQSLNNSPAQGINSFSDFIGDPGFFKYYQQSFDDIGKYAELNGLTTGVTLCLYAERVDNTDINSLYKTPVTALDVASINSNLSIVRELDTSFEIQCPQSSATDVHYVMAFAEEITDQSIFNDYAFITNFKNAAKEVNNPDSVSLDQYYTVAEVTTFDTQSTIGTNIVHRGSYYIYAYALRTSTGVNDIEFIQGTAVNIPVISFVSVNFDQYDDTML